MTTAELQNAATISAKRMEGRRAFVTGGGSGIGKATAIRLAAEGASVAIADIRGDSAAAVAADIEAGGGTAIGVETDIASEASIEAGVSEAVRAFGGLDAVFANAGTAGSGWLHETTLDDWETVIRVNLTGTFLTAKHTIPHLLTNGGGAIVTTGSISSQIIALGGAAASYAASKGGVLQLTKAIAVDYGPQGIRANCLCPGVVRTRLAHHVRADTENHTTPVPEGGQLPRQMIQTPIPRVGTPEEQAAVAVFLLSDEASFMTASAVTVDGGYTAV
jgi:NAD(P)-dependent dehydrogenase (short-subunit alcohol dehydrogenase family)